MKSNGLTKCILAVVMLAAHPSLGAAKQAGGRLRGAVVDRMGARVAGARVTVASNATRQEVRSDEEGKFELELPPATYAISVESPGFSIKRLKRVRIESGTSKEVTLILKVAPIKTGKCPKGRTCIWL